MTTIAWKGRDLAADTMALSGILRQYVPQKICRLPDGSLIGHAGGTETALIVIQWFRDGERQEVKPKFEGDEWPRIILLRSDGSCWEYEKHLVPMRIYEQFWAIGSGRELAIGAMAQGASARGAVEIAMRWDTGSGGEVEVLST